MKNLLIVFLIIIGFSKFIYSQDSQYFDAPFGGGGGFVPGWYVPNMDGVNLQLNLEEQDLFILDSFHN